MMMMMKNSEERSDEKMNVKNININNVDLDA